MTKKSLQTVDDAQKLPPAEREEWLEHQISQIQESTQSNRLLQPLHEWLRLHSKLYYGWHLTRYHVVVQWIVLGLVVGIEIFLIATVIIGLIIALLFASYDKIVPGAATAIETLKNAFPK